MKPNDYEREQEKRYMDDPDVQAYEYCMSEEAEEVNRALRESIKKAKEQLEREQAMRKSVEINEINKKDVAEMTNKELYIWLQCTDNLKDVSWEKQEIGDGMAVIKISIYGWWKPIFLLDDRNQIAVQFMNMSEYLQTVKYTDIDWTTVTPNLDGYKNAQSLFGGFPTSISDFRNNVGYVEWQINPDGRYFMDEDGYGMTTDEEVALYGYIDRNGNVVEPFRYINDNWDELKRMRKRAEKIVNS